MKQFGKPPPPPKRNPLSTKPTISAQFFMTPSLSKFQKRETPQILGGSKL